MKKMHRGPGQFETLLKCLKCESTLEVDREFCACPQCGANWPVSRGIPRFFQSPSYYWGEIGRTEAVELLDAARKGPWIEAVLKSFSSEMAHSLLDLQRAAWLPMLGLDENSVALDIGSGYGTITHSMSQVVGEVYSVEAISERLEFTQERLHQEGIRNVRLIQASAVALPFTENSFDLIVVNGILEWVGEWDLVGNPRDAQLRFLDRVRRLLKDDGVLVIGIENRVGYGLIRWAQQDHSGIAYTSLVPRRMASFMLRHSSALHHRTQLNPHKEYRTYTYTRRGYRKLLGDAGFAASSCYWAVPAYNQPHQLIPLTMPAWVAELFLDLDDHPSPRPKRLWQSRLKRVLAHSRLLHPFLPDFVLMASKRSERRTKLYSWLQTELAQDHERNDGVTAPPQLTWALQTRYCSRKSIVRLGNQANGRDVAFLKVYVGTGETQEKVEAELVNLAMVRESFNEDARYSFGLPRTLSTHRVGKTFYCLEAAAAGISISRMVYRLGYFADARRVENDFARIIECVIEMTRALQKVSGASAIASGWRDRPEELIIPVTTRAGMDGGLSVTNSSSEYPAGWVQHGDFSVENVFLDRHAGSIEVIDWADLAAGFPPLYDLFTLFFSAGYLSPMQEGATFSNEEERWVASFRATFWSDTSFSRIVRKLILRACEQLGVPQDLIPSLMIEFLLVRSHYYKRKSPGYSRLFRHLLQLCLGESVSVFGQFPITPAITSRLITQ
jgi:ubiquinone/menaquinone biosynthesis C-methylase UbiE